MKILAAVLFVLWAAGFVLQVPDEERPVLEAYREWAGFLKSQSKDAAAVEARARKFEEVCVTSRSAMLGFDPSTDLLEYAAALSAAGRPADAARVRAVAQAYRDRQVSNLIMQGGSMLDPARFHGRPAVPERFVGNGFSVAWPPLERWAPTTLLRHTVSFVADGSLLANGQSVVMIVHALKPAFKTDPPPRDFPAAVENLIRDTTTGRFRVTAVSATPRPGSRPSCADFKSVMEERDNPAFPNILLEITEIGFACLDQSRQFGVKAYYSERRPAGLNAPVDPRLIADAEAFLREVIVKRSNDDTIAAIGADQPQVRPRLDR